MGHEADDLLSAFDTLGEEDIFHYRYPDDHDLHAIGVLGIYLGNYIRWDPKAQHELMMRDYGYLTAAFTRTFDCYDHVDCFNYMGIHDLLKLYKHGYSKVTDHACREIRHGRITRNQGLMLVKKFEHASVPDRELFCQWLGMTPLSLQFVLDQHRNADYWTEDSPGSWTFKGWSTHSEVHDKASGTAGIGSDFIGTDTLEYGQVRRYVTVGKGYP